LISDLDFHRFSAIHQVEEDEESAGDGLRGRTVLCVVDFQWIFCLLDSLGLTMR
jgi:hypothetical protein